MTDKYLWLEDILGTESLEWVNKQNKRTEEVFNKGPGFKELVDDIQVIHGSKEKIPYVHFIEQGYVYNTWNDTKNIQGLIRRATIEEYNKVQPAWENLIDLDELSKIENQKWVSHGISISPNGKRAMVFLSPGGTDADVGREFDLVSKSFVAGGLELPLSKGGAEWFGDDELLVTRDFGPETLTTAGYPRQLRKWKRGEILEDSEIIFSVSKDDTFVDAAVYENNNRRLLLAHRRIDFYSGEVFQYDGLSFKKLDTPLKADIGHDFEFLYMELKENWKGFLLGDIIACELKTNKLELIYRPDKKSSVASFRQIKDGFLLIVDTDVKGNLHYVHKVDGAWSIEKMDMPTTGTLAALATNVTCNDFYINYDSFNMPSSYFYGQKNKVEKIVKHQPAFFDFENIDVHQHFVTSLDGTQVPYFLAHKKSIKYDGTNPTILYGYGGFQVSLNVHCNNVLGKSWLDKGGVYVLANIRGGGEYGPLWHQAALKENRDRAYQDFFAIAEDLIARKITSPEHLGASGGSNGGLLMGVCFTQRPDLFKAINCAVPLLDMHRYHLLLAGHSWVAEYGDPADERDGKYIRNLSPYHRIKKDEKNYPIIFLNTSTKDDRVHPGHARKFAATLEEYGHEYLYHENINGGHSGSSDLKELAFISALDYAFFWKYLK